MRSLKILHTADLHLDSPFEYMSAAHAVIRRSEQRQLLDRLADLARINNVDIVLMSGDLFESAMTYAETEEQLARSLRALPPYASACKRAYIHRKQDRVR